VLEDEVTVLFEKAPMTVLEGATTVMLKERVIAVLEEVAMAVLEEVASAVLEKATTELLEVDPVEVELEVIFEPSPALAVFCQAQMHPVSPPSVEQTSSAAQVLIVPNWPPRQPRYRVVRHVRQLHTSQAVVRKYSSILTLKVLALTSPTPVLAILPLIYSVGFGLRHSDRRSVVRWCDRLVPLPRMQYS
jgi:hypothetical protein